MKFLRHLTTICAIFLCSQQAHSQVLDSAFYNWTVYEYQEDELDEKKCYIVSNPITSETDHNARIKPYLMITRFQKRRIEEVSIFGGYDYKTGSDIYLLIDKNYFKLTTKGDMAWVKTKAEDIQLIQTLLNYSSLKVRSDSDVGTYAIDEYSMQGIAKAYARMRRICR